MHRPVLVIVCALVLPTLLAVPAHGGDAVIRNGIDLWHTSPGGESYTDFARDPIRADFDPQGIARVRTQVRALSLIGTQPLEAGCGQFEVTATLDGSEQPITEMTIRKANEAGGPFVAHLELRAKLSFRPLGKTLGEPLELFEQVDFSRETVLPWAYEPAEHSVLYEGFIKADTDGDGVPDTFLPGTSTFVTDHAVAGDGQEALTPCCTGGCWWLVCRCNPEATDPTTSYGGCQKLHCSVKVFAVCARNSCSDQTVPPGPTE